MNWILHLTTIISKKRITKSSLIIIKYVHNLYKPCSKSYKEPFNTDWHCLAAFVFTLYSFLLFSQDWITGRTNKAKHCTALRSPQEDCGCSNITRTLVHKDAAAKNHRVVDFLPQIPTNHCHQNCRSAPWGRFPHWDHWYLLHRYASIFQVLANSWIIWITQLPKSHIHQDSKSNSNLQFHTVHLSMFEGLASLTVQQFVWNMFKHPRGQRRVTALVQRPSICTTIYSSWVVSSKDTVGRNVMDLCMSGITCQKVGRYADWNPLWIGQGLKMSSPCLWVMALHPHCYTSFLPLALSLHHCLNGVYNLDDSKFTRI